MAKSPTPADDREARLKAALRANLRRRKQAPGSGAPTAPPPLCDEPKRD